MSVSWILKEKGRNVVSVLPRTTMKEVVGILAKHKIGAVVVADEFHRIAGILSERDVVRRLASDGPSFLDKPVSEFMTKPVISCQEHHTIDWVMGQMTANRFRHMPVTDQGRLAGIVSIGDVVKFKIAMAESEAAQMRQYFVAG